MSDTTARTTSERIARGAFVGHALLIVFSTTALVTILAGIPPAWLSTEPAATIYRYGWQLSGPLYVILGALAALLHATGRLGAGRALALLGAAGVLSLGAELLGTSTGLPFGPYEYTSLLGYRILGLVPFPIPLSWFFMLYGALAICSRLLPARDDRATRLRWTLAAALILTAWDVSMDPAMSYVTKHWVWHTEGVFYGMPFLNWFGWMVTGGAIAWVMLMIAPPSVLAASLRSTTLPIALYAVNGVMPLAMMARAGLWPGFVLGLLAMAIPVGLALWATDARRSVQDALSLPTGAPSSASETAPARR